MNTPLFYALWTLGILVVTIAISKSRALSQLQASIPKTTTLPTVVSPMTMMPPVTLPTTTPMSTFMQTPIFART